MSETTEIDFNMTTAINLQFSRDEIQMKSLLDRAFNAQVESSNDAKVVPPAPQFESADDEELRKLVESIRVNISIIGCGGGGCNTVHRLVQSGVTGATLVAANSDARHLLNISVQNKILLGRLTTKGLGAGAIADVGRQSAEEAKDDIRKFIDGRQIVFITAGMGGGTGTGSAPYVAKMARTVRGPYCRGSYTTI